MDEARRHEAFERAGLNWAVAEGDAKLKEAILKAKFSELVNRSNQSSIIKAEHWARVQPEYTAAMEESIEANTAAIITKVKMKAQELRFEEWRTLESTARARMGLR